MKEPYSKHKDRDPQGTVDSIVGMLEQAGLDTEMRWTSVNYRLRLNSVSYSQKRISLQSRASLWMQTGSMTASRTSFFL